MKTVPVLDHGYVRFVDKMGSDESFVEAARMSTQKGFLGWSGTDICPRCYGSGSEPSDVTYNCEECNGQRFVEVPGDERLLRFLWTAGHVSPFEFGQLAIELSTPVFVARQILRHWSLSVNEASARYGALPEVDYLPTVERLMANADGSNKQANRIAGAPALTEEGAEEWLELLECHYEEAQKLYEEGLKIGVPKELARIALTFGRYTNFRLSGNVRDWLFFLKKRLPEDAQWETRQFAISVAEILSEHFPRTYALFAEG